MDMTSALLHDQTTIPVLVAGSGPAVLLPVRWERFDAATAETMRAWGADPDAGPALIENLASRFRVIAADYEGHRMAHPAPDTLTAEAVATDFLAIADGGEGEHFAYYGYSWLALAGLQLALGTDRLWALVMGGFPPLDGPYAEMLSVTRAAHAMAEAQAAAPAGSVPSPSEVEVGDWDSVAVQTSPEQTRQFVTLYESLIGFDDAAVQPRLTVPRLAFAGANDTITYGEAWGNTVVRIGPPLARNREKLESMGWDARVLPDLDHIAAMRGDVVVPLLSEWLSAVGGVTRRLQSATQLSSAASHPSAELQAGGRRASHR